MPFVNFGKREVNFKIVYYGPPLGGKTTNVQHLHRTMPPEVRGDITILSTDQDRTLYFDFLPLESKAIKGFISRFQLYTVPGQPIYDKTRRIVLTGVDGIVFVADSQWQCIESTLDSFQNMQDNLKAHNRSLEDTPYVLQFNKRDLQNIAPAVYLDFMLNQNVKTKAQHFEAVAVSGIGVKLTLNTICKMVMAKFIEEHRGSLG